MDTSPPDIPLPGPVVRGPAISAPPGGPSLVRYILFGREGLRAGWGIILFVAIYAAIERCLLPLRSALLHPQPIRGDILNARQTFSIEGVGIVALIVATWMMARLERRRVATFGFAPQMRARYFLRGLAWGLALLSLLVFLLRGLGLLVFDAWLLNGAALLHYASLWLAGFLLVAVQEELHFRCYLQFTLTRGLRSLYRWLFGPRFANALGFWTAAAALSYYFGAGHGANPDESPIGIFSAVVAGLLFCFSLWRTGSLWWAIGFHASWDWAQSFVYGVPDSGLMARGHLFATHAVGRAWLSGGATGPEGSILFLPVALAAAGIVLLSLPSTHHGYIPVRDEAHPTTVPSLP